VLNYSGKEIVFNNGMKQGFIEILKLLNNYFSSPVILLTNEISNGFFFENIFGSKPKELANFEIGLLKQEYTNLIDQDKYRRIEDNEAFSIFMQKNGYVKWN